MKEIVRHFTEEEKEFMRKYGDRNLYFWETLSDSQKADYLSLENLYHDFFELYNNHYEDLKLYALYCRNVNIQNCNQDPTSVLFFGWNKKKIYGFGKYDDVDYYDPDLGILRIIDSIGGKEIIGFKEKIGEIASKKPNEYRTCSTIDEWADYYKAKLALLYVLA